MKKTMLLATLIAFLPTLALAAGNGSYEGIGLVAWIFLFFVGLIVTTQFVPALVLFGAMLRGLLTRGESRIEAAGRN